MCKESHKARLLLSNFGACNKSFQAQVVFLPSSSKDLTAKCTRNRNMFTPISNNFGACSNRCECSQAHLVFLPSSSKDLTAKCARNTNTFALTSNNFGACTNRYECAQTHLVLQLMCYGPYCKVCKKVRVRFKAV